MEKSHSWIKECFNTKGRWNRKKFWLYPLGITLLTIVPLFIVAYLIMLSAGEQSGILDIILAGLFIIWYIVLIYVNILTYIKRLRDLDKNPWMTLILFVPFLSIALLIYCGFWKGTSGDNKFGPDPLGGTAHASEVEKVSESAKETKEEL